MAEIQGIKTRWWVIGGIGAAGVVYWAYKRQQASAAAAQTSTQDPNIDPNTGLPYSAEYGSGGSSPVGLTPSLYGYTDQFGNLITPGTGQPIVTAPTTNAAWAQQAESYLTNQGGYDGPTVIAALGKALAGIALTDNELAIVQAASGFLGPPPQGWPNGAPHGSPPGGQGVTGPIATRTYSPGTTAIVVHYSKQGGWHQVAQDYYTWDQSKVPLWMVGDSLAHYNGRSGLSNPAGSTVVLPAKLYQL